MLKASFHKYNIVVFGALKAANVSDSVGTDDGDPDY